MTYIKINDLLYPAEINGRIVDNSWDNRESKAITLEMTHADAVGIFVDGLKWAIVYKEEEVSEEYDNSAFNIAGPITDNRDGTITAKMGKPTVDELLAQINNQLKEV